jgi:hypothetical protein
MIVLAALFVTLAKGNAAGPAQSMTSWGQYSCITTSLGYCSGIPHQLGAVPEAMSVTPLAPIGGTPKIAGSYIADSFTKTTFRIRAIWSSGGALANARVAFSFIAFATQPAPPPTNLNVHS